MMQEKFSLYDFFGLIIPGLGALALAAFTLRAGFGLSWWPNFQDWGVAFAGAVALFVLGHIVQDISGRVERLEQAAIKWLDKDAEGHTRPSEHLLNPTTTSYTQEFLDLFHAKVKAKLGLEPTTYSNARERRREIFNLCQSYVVQNGDASRQRKFLGFWQFHRNMATTALLAAGAGVAVIALQLARLVFKVLPIHWPTYDPTMVLLSILLIALSLFSYPMFRKNQHRFSESFADAVIRSFYTVAK